MVGVDFSQKGKLITYMQHKLPIIASVNPGNDIIQLVQNARVGFATSDGDLDILEYHIKDIS